MSSVYTSTDKAGILFRCGRLNAVCDIAVGLRCSLQRWHSGDWLRHLLAEVAKRCIAKSQTISNSRSIKILHVVDNCRLNSSTKFALKKLETLAFRHNHSTASLLLEVCRRKACSVCLYFIFILFKETLWVGGYIYQRSITMNVILIKCQINIPEGQAKMDERTAKCSKKIIDIC